MKNTLNFSVSLSTVVLASTLALISLPTQAAGCKGLSDSQCSEEAQCRWVKGYARSDGRQVNGYCRTQMVKSKMLKVDKQAKEEAMEEKPKG